MLGKKVESFKNAMLSYPQFVNTTISGFLPIPSSRDISTVFPEGEVDSKRPTPMHNWVVDYDYINTLDMKIIQGRDFSRDFSTDTSATIINQTAAEKFLWDKPLEKRVGRVTSRQGDIELYTVIGVVEDFLFESLRNTIELLVMF